MERSIEQTVFDLRMQPDGLGEPLSVDAWFVGQVTDNLEEWLRHPRLTSRPALRAWALDAPPADKAE